MNWYIIKLEFPGPIHIGSDEAGIGIEVAQSMIHSDTIFSAMVNAASLLNIEYINFLLQGNFLLSSAFPYSKNCYFLPKPLYPFSSIFRKHSNEIKKINYLQDIDYLSWINGYLNEENIPGVISRSQQIEEISDYNVRPRNMIDRQISNTIIYHCGGMIFQKNCGLYFILETDSKGLKTFEDILNVLKRLGIGGERSIGYGQFDFKVEGAVDTTINVWKNIKNNKGNYYSLLSLSFPENIENINATAYQTVLRKGWLYSTSSFKQMKRKTLRMFQEGSVFANYLEGKIVDNLSPPGFKDHKVYRWGKSFLVKMNTFS